MTDGTLIEANAALDSLQKKQCSSAPSNQLSTSIQAEPKIPKLGHRIISNKTHISMTDPDATLAKKAGMPRKLRYKAHLSIDADSRVILSIQATTGACHESQLYSEHVKAIMQEFQLTLEEAIADRAYGTGEILQAITAQKIVPYIPLFTDKVGTMLERVTEHFTFDQTHNRYQCPAGFYLLPYARKTKDRRVMYRSRSRDCRGCLQITKCKAPRMKHSHMRYIRRNQHQALFETTLIRMQTPIFVERLLERFWKIEGIISEIKNRHGLARAKYRGLQKMQMQAYLSASIVNIKRLIQAFLCLFYYMIIANSVLKFRDYLNNLNRIEYQ